MAADKVFFKVYRGSQGTSLPEEKHDGALYVLQTSDETGELWADIYDTRIKFASGAVAKTTAEWESDESISKAGQFYVYLDGYGENAPALKIGNGQSLVRDLPFVTVSQNQFNFWNNKLNYKIDNSNPENLIFTRD